MQQQPVDVDCLNVVLNREMGLIHAFANVVEIPEDIISAMSNLLRLLNAQGEETPPSAYAEVVAGSMG